MACLYTHISLIIIRNSIFTRQVNDNPTTGLDKSTRKILVDKSTTINVKEKAGGLMPTSSCFIPLF